nr:hypothetical protein [Tanacetum cinerariifolium]
MTGYTVKDTMMNFGKLDKFEGHDFRRWQKKMHFLLTTLKVVYVLTKPMPELVEDPTMNAIRISTKWDNDDYICRGHILNDMSDSLFDVYMNVESAKEFWDSLESKIFGQYTQHGLKMDESISVSSIINKLHPSWKDFKHTLKHGKEDLSFVQLGSHLHIEESLRVQDSDKGKGKEVGGPSVNMTEEGKNKHNKQNKGIAVVVKRTTQMLVVREKSLRTNPKTKVDAIAWWIYSGATTHVCKDRFWFITFKPVEDGSVLYMGDEHFAPVHGKRSVYESDKYILSMSGVFVGFSYYNNGHVHNKIMLELSKDDLIPAIDENPEKYTTSPYIPHINGVAERKNRALKEMVNFMLSYSGLSEGFWGAPCCRAVVRLPDLKRKTLGEKGIDCIFVGYAEHSKAYKFYVTEPNDSIYINSIIESKDAIFDENHFSTILKPKDIIPNVQESQRDVHYDDVPSEIPEPQKVKREDPRTYNEAMQSQDVAFWKEAIDDETGSIMENNTWTLSNLPPGCKLLGCKWIFKRKMKVDGKIDKFKARLVIQGFRQKEGIDYFDTYAPFARITTIRLMLALTAIYNLMIHQVDVKTTFS